MCDMQKMPAREDASCDEDSDMNFATFSAVGGGTHYVTAGGQIQKIQQTVANNGGLQQVVGMVGGVNMGEGLQYVRTIDGTALQATPQLITVPIALPGSKPGDPQQTVQIQVLTPNMLQQQQPKYQMQIPIQGFQQGGAVLTVAYSPENNDTGGIQLLGNTLPEGVQVVQMPQEVQLMAPQETKQEPQQIQHQVFITPNQQIIINRMDVEDGKVINNNNTVSNNNNNNNSIDDVVIKQECDENMADDDSSQGTEASDNISWTSTSSGQADLIKYLNTLQPQQAQALPVSLQQFLKLNPSDNKKVEQIQIEVSTVAVSQDTKEGTADVTLSEDGTIRIKKKKKYKKKPPRPARPKPGQVVIATAADGTPIFCCPECHMAYPDKEQLEMHLIVHKIERRFICGICGAGLKRKEHLERHKLGHNPERPFVCGVCGKGFKRREHLNLHTVIHSGVKTELCGECGKGFYRKDHLRKHTRSHEHRRARDEASLEPAPAPPDSARSVLPEITIHVPTSGNMNVPVQINIPQHVVTSLAASQQQAETLDALLGQHS